MNERKTLWMRYVNFVKVKDLLHLVYINNGKLRAGTLEELGIENEILIKNKDKTPFSHTTRYHYRKVMEGLGLIELRNRFYYIYKDKRIFKFLNLTNFKTSTITNEAKEILREIIVENGYCKKYFFDIFIQDDTYSLRKLRKEGKHIMVKTKSMEEINKTQRNEKNDKIKKSGKSSLIVLKGEIGKIIKLKSLDEIQAIFWGVRLWSLNLEITDEVLVDFSEGRIIYPINPDFSNEQLNKVLINYLKKFNGDKEWIEIHIPKLIKEIALSYHFPIIKIKDFLINLKNKYPLLIMFIPTSIRFLEVKTPFKKQDIAVRNIYLYEKEKGYISHIRIHKKFLKEV